MTTDLPSQFLDYGRHMRGWSSQTIRTYEQSLRVLPSELSRASLNDLVVALKKRGLANGGINVKLRSINSYLSWLYAEGYTPERLKVRLLPDPPKPITPISDVEVRRLVVFRAGDDKLHARTVVLIMLLLDARSDEDISPLARVAPLSPPRALRAR